MLKDASGFIVTLILITAARNVNGVRQRMKTCALSPDFPSEKLAEASFERDGRLHTFSSMSKTESDGGFRRLLYVCGIIPVAVTMRRDRKQRASGYDDSPYYGGYAEPPYNPPYNPEDENAPYDDGGPAPWETDAWKEDGVSYPADGADEIESEVLNPENAEQPYDNSGAAFDAPDIPYGTDASSLEDDPPPEVMESPEGDYPATDEDSESGRGDVSDL